MALFDFLKKKELQEIQRLKSLLSERENEIRLLNEDSTEKTNKITLLNERLSKLEKYQGIVDVDTVIQEKIKSTDKMIAEKNQEIEGLKRQAETLRNNYKDAYRIYQNLKKESDIYKETIGLAEYGIYEPHFDFNTSQEYKLKLIHIRERQKSLVAIGLAVLGGESISWNGSLSQGQAMVKREKKLMLRAFNGECDSFIADVDWNNVSKMEERINKSYEAINRVYEKQGVFINEEYKNLKLEELHLAFEYRDKIHKEKEEQRAIREQMREEEKARREIEAALIKSQKDEEIYQKALAKARAEIGSAQGDKLNKLQAKITELEARVAEAEQNRERALSMAQQTKRGHVYVISNIGSFGENIYKIGMTRRLDPMDRIRELGDASVPFPFDVHAIIFSEDAPSLENELHKAFESKRVNLVNPRKEFFNVTLDEIEKIVHKNNASIEFTQLAEARDYRETNALKERQIDKAKITESVFAPELGNNL